jgi:hypothetical protein
MIKFKGLLLHYLPKEAHYNFFSRVTKEIAAAGAPVQIALGQLLVDLNDWFEKETANMIWQPKSSLTRPITAAKKRLDRAFVGLSVHIRATRYSPDPDVVRAASRLYIMLKSYSYVIRDPYLQEAGAITAILLHLKGDMAADAQTIGLTEWIVEVESALDTFVGLIRQREAGTLSRPEKRLREVRHTIDKIWHQVATVINSGAMMNTSPEFAALIKTLNPEIEYLNAEYHQVRRNIWPAIISPIEPQPYTGLPCTPVPDVFYETSEGTEKLILGKDYNITYKKNIQPGNASCIIHGKGAYKGRKIVTFIINN